MEQACASKMRMAFFRQAATIAFNLFLQVHEGEALACLATLNWLAGFEIIKAIIESDCLRVVIVVNSQSHAKFGIIIRQIRNFLLCYPNFTVSYARRQAKLVTHALERASNVHASHHDYHHIPFCIAQQIFMEMK